MTRLFANEPLLRALNGDALRSPKLQHRQRRRLRLARAATTSSFDVIVVDFPDPTNFSIGKLYTTRFYALLDQHLAAERLRGRPDHLAAGRAPELLDRGDHARVGRPAAPTPYHAHVPSFGEWGFVLASRRPFRLPTRAAGGPALPRPGRRCRAVRLSARHGAGAGRGEPAVQPGAGDDLRARVGQGAAVSDAARRRAAGAAAAARAAWPACARRAAGHRAGGWHRRRASSAATALRDAHAAATACPRRRVQRRAGVIVVGAGVAGLAAARALRRPASRTFVLLELEDAAGGNSRGDAMRRHRLPARRALPAAARRRRRVEVQDLLEELGLRRTRGAAAGLRRAAPVPQPAGAPVLRRRLAGRPAAAVEACRRRARATLAQYRRFAGARGRARRRRRASRSRRARARWTPRSPALDALHLRDLAGRARASPTPALRWYLDYCCRDDYGAGAAQVSAWAGLHYFASRHGFHAPGDGRRRARRAC